MGAPTSPVEVHHGVLRCLLRLRDRADAHREIDGEGIQLWLDYECEALRRGVDPEIGREELAAMVEASAVEIPEAEHAEDFARWGRRGACAPWPSTARRGSPSWR